MRVKRFRAAAVAGVAALALVVSACGSSSDTNDTGASADAGDSAADDATDADDTTDDAAGDDAAVGEVDAATATSAEDFGGMDGLIAAAQAEGELNVIALPPDWANYGAIIQAFSDTYNIKVNSQNPNGSSAEEIEAAKTNAGTDKAPDVFDLGAAVAMSSLDHFAAYKVATWDDIPDENKDADGLWVNDYTGVMSIGYNATKYGDIDSIDNLLEDRFAGTLALNGNPTQAGAAFAGVVMMALANGGSADDIAPGVDWFVSAKDAGTFVPLDPTPATVESGQTGVVIDWSYNQMSFTSTLAEQGVEWKMFVPDDAAVGGYYVQAINNDAPHPAAARLWQEFLFSDVAQNLYMAGGAQPVRYAAMKEQGVIDPEAAKNLPETSSPIVQLTPEQTDAANAVLNEQWSRVA